MTDTRHITQAPIDHALSVFLAERAGLDGAEKQAFARIISFLSESLRDGHICIELTETQQRIVEKSRLVSDEANLPLVLHNSRLYLARYFSYESRLVQNFNRIATISYQLPGLDRLLESCFPGTADGPDYQRQAVRLALSRALTIIGGGPGTGKTTTIVKIVGLLLTFFGPDLRIVLAAPTGKAAVRMGESISALIPLMPFENWVREAMPKKAMTLHRLLGTPQFGAGFRHDRNNPLSWDVVLVDEASMVDLAMMSKLVDALKERSRLILLGDKDQLASVESGAVLADCIKALPDNVVELKESFRFDKEIAAFADAINRGDDEQVWTMLDGESIPALRPSGENWLEQFGDNCVRYMEKVQSTSFIGDYPCLFELFHEFQVLCAVKNGKRGVSAVNAQVERLLLQHGFRLGKEPWYQGRPVMITRNDYTTGLFNGDIGLCLPDPQRDGALGVWFEQSGGGLRCFPPTRVPACETVWAMTIHKSQGSEYDEILIILPDQDSQVLCRELLYTAVTRARKRVSILAEKEVLAITVKRKTKRYSGLAERLAVNINE